jgi:hypothetical protein
MKHKQARFIFGTAITAAAIAVAIDHSRQRLPQPGEQLASQQAVIIIDEGEEMPAENNADCGKPASLGRQAPPCSL